MTIQLLSERHTEEWVEVLPTNRVWISRSSVQCNTSYLLQHENKLLIPVVLLANFLITLLLFMTICKLKGTAITMPLRSTLLSFVGKIIEISLVSVPVFLFPALSQSLTHSTGSSAGDMRTDWVSTSQQQSDVQTWANTPTYLPTYPFRRLHSQTQSH